MAQAPVALPTDFSSVERYCMFIGYPRSGHTLTGALLDAHPEAVIAHELDALGYIREGASRTDLFQRILERSREFAESGGEWSGYNYLVPGQWNGRFQRLRVLGDKKGGKSAMLLRESPHLLDALESTIGLAPHFVHIVRNPFDNIATMFRRSQHQNWDTTFDAYFQRCETIQNLRGRIPAERWLEFRHETFVADPRLILSRLLAFLDLAADASYLDACTAIVFDKPRQSRHDAPWPEGFLDRITGEIPRFAHLEGYTF